MSEIPELDAVVHAPIRLAVMTLLSATDQVDFSYLKEMTGSSDGNLSVHMAKLEKAGYVKSKKQFAGKKPQTTYRITAAGRTALVGYVRDLRTLLATNPALSLH